MKPFVFLTTCLLIAVFCLGMVVWMVTEHDAEAAPAVVTATGNNSDLTPAGSSATSATKKAPAPESSHPQPTTAVRSDISSTPARSTTAIQTSPASTQESQAVTPTPVTAAPVARTPGQPARTILPLESDWRFIKREVVGGFAPQLDEGLWTTVSVPHTWNAEDGQDGPTKVSLTGGYHRGVGWYRRYFEVPAQERGREAYLIFEGVSQQCTVYLNGQPVGEHKGGFASFSFNVTKLLKAEGSNTLAVRASNAFDRNIMPLRGDFTIFGGIYRPVRLVFVEPVHFAMNDDGSTGLQVVQREVSAERAVVEVETTIDSGAAAAEQVEVAVAIADHAGTVLATQSQTVSVKPGEPRTLSFPLTLTKPHLWNGRFDPYLHQVTARIVHTGVVADEARRHLGLRFFRLTADAGFSLNGAPYDLYGVCMHQGGLDKGWATTAADQRRDVEMVAEMGARFVRLAHYQHSQETYRACDELGLLVWSEIPLVYSSSNTKEFSENCQQQLLEMVRQNRSHCSVICWGLFNHVAAMDHQIKQLQDLTRIAREVDPTRFTAGAATHAEETQTTRITDAIGFNVYFGWYLPDYNMYATWADDFRAKNPGRIFGLSEYGAGANISQHSEAPARPMMVHIKKMPHPEEYQSLYHEEVWRYIRTNRELWCKLIWSMFDYATDERTDAELDGRCDMGLVTIDRKVKKDAFYWYQANWTTEPMVHITSRRFSRRERNVIDIKAYTNADVAVLRVNGKALDPIEPSDHRLIWKGVALQPGNNVVTVTAVHQGKAVTDQVTWIAP